MTDPHISPERLAELERGAKTGCYVISISELRALLQAARERDLARDDAASWLQQCEDARTLALELGEKLDAVTRERDEAGKDWLTARDAHDRRLEDFRQALLVVQAVEATILEEHEADADHAPGCLVCSALADFRAKYPKP